MDSSSSSSSSSEGSVNQKNISSSGTSSGTVEAAQLPHEAEAHEQLHHEEEQHNTELQKGLAEEHKFYAGWRKVGHWGLGLLLGLKDRLLLTHVVRPNAPIWDIIKCGLVSVVVLLADRATLNPDHLSATFTAFLCISPLTSSGFFIGLNIWIASLIGTFIGTAVSACYFVESTDSDFFWNLVVKTPIASCLTMYALLVAKRYAPGDVSSGLFSAIFVQMIQFEYEPMDGVSDDPRMLVLTTLIVRIIALTTAVLSATLVNFVASAWAVKSIFTARTFFVEQVIWESFNSLSTVPTSPQSQDVFGMLMSLLSDVRTALKEPYLTKGTKKTLNLIQKRLEHVFCLLSLQVMLCLLSEELVLSDEERRSLKKLLDMSHIRNMAMINYVKTRPPPPEGTEMAAVAAAAAEDHHPHPLEGEEIPPTVELLARCLRATDIALSIPTQLDLVELDLMTLTVKVARKGK